VDPANPEPKPPTFMNSSPTPSPAALPPVIPLVRYVPTRRAFDLRSFDPASVRTTADLPPYLVLGPLEESSFMIGAEGWSAVYRGVEDGTQLQLAYRLPHGLYSLHQTWHGIEGGMAGGEGRLSLDRVVAQFLYRQFPAAWEKAASATLNAAHHVHCVAPPAHLPSFCGFPDGALRTVAFPVAVSALRSVRSRLADLAALMPDYPLAAEARLVTQVLHFDERMTAAWRTVAKSMLERSTAQTGIAPLGPLECAMAPNGLATRALRRGVYLVCVTVPFAGLADLLAKLSGPNSPIRGAADPVPADELRPLVLPAGLVQLGGTIDVWLPRQPSGCRWLFADPFGRSPGASGADGDWSPERAEELLQVAEHGGGVDDEDCELVTLDEFVDESEKRRKDARVALLRRLPALVEHSAFRAALEAAVGESGPRLIAAGRKGVALALDDWDALIDHVNDIYGNLAKPIVTLSWDSETPMGSSGASWIHELAGVYVFSSSDWPAAGPFDSLQEALDGNESFSMTTANAAIDSAYLSEDRLRKLAQAVVPDDGPVWVNGKEHVLVGRKLCPVDEDA